MGEDSCTVRTRRLAALDVSCIGMFLLVSFPTAVALLLTGGSSESDVWGLGGMSALARAMAFAALALLSRRVVSVLGRPVLLVGCAFVMAGGALCRAASLVWLTGDGSIAVSAVSSVVMNAGYAVLYLAWMELYSQMDTRHVILYFTLVHFLSALTSYALFSLGASFVALFLVAVMPPASVMLLRRSDTRTADAPYRQGEMQRMDWSISLRPIVLLVAFSFSNAIVRSFLGLEDQATVLFGVCAASLGVLAVVLAKFDRFEVKSLYQVSVPVLVAGALFVLMNGAWCGVAAALCSNAAFTLFSVFITVVFCGIAYRYGVNAVWLFGITQASLTFGSFAGKVLSAWGGELLFDPAMLVTTMSTLVVLLIALSMMLVSDRDFKTTWGITDRSGEVEGRSWVDEEERLVQRCSRMAQRYGLTRREEEVLMLMMKDCTLSRIGEVLFIADSTMKTHSRHIYRKVGVQNRQELQDFVDAYRM